MGDRTALEAMKEFHAVVGEIASGWAAFEDYIESALWVLADLKQSVGRAITKNIRSNDQLDIVGTLLKERFVEKFLEVESEWKSLRAEVNNLRATRNAIVHSNWEGMDDQRPDPILVSLKYEGRNGTTSQPISFSYGEMVEAKDAIVRIKYKFINYIEQNFKIHPPTEKLTIEQFRKAMQREPKK